MIVLKAILVGFVFGALAGMIAAIIIGEFADWLGRYVARREDRRP